MSNHDDKQHSWLMRLMMLCCVLPLLLIIFGAGGSILGVPVWAIFSGLAIIIIVRFLMATRSANDFGKERETSDKENKTEKNNHSDSDRHCCH